MYAYIYYLHFYYINISKQSKYYMFIHPLVENVNEDFLC